MKNHAVRLAVRAVLALAVAAGVAHGATIIDNFNASHNYLSNGLAGTIWDGLYTGQGSFPGQTAGSGATFRADADITGAGLLTVQSSNTGWENTADNGFFLFKNVTGDFSVTVHVISPFDVTSYDTAGLMARATGSNGAPFGGKENYVSWTRMDQFGFANYLRSTVNNKTAQINPGDYPNTNYWLRMDRVNDTNFNFYEKAHQSDPWQQLSFPSPVNGTTLVRPDLRGLPLQVGIIHASFFVIPLQVQFEDFTLTSTNVGEGPVTIVTEPQSESVLQGRTVNFVANVTGADPVYLQWYQNGMPLSGETNLTLSFPATLADNGANYQLVAVNFYNDDIQTAVTTNVVLSVTADTTPPVLLSVQGSSSNGVILTFSEPLGAGTATNPVNFRVDDLLGPGGTATVNAATLDATGTIVTLNTSFLLSGSGYVVTATNVMDLAGNVIVPGNWLAFQVPPPPLITTLADNFNFSHDYLASGLAGTMWDGLYTGAGSFPGQNPGPVDGQTLKADANITGAAELTVESEATDWEAYDDGFFLFKNVTGDFSVSVHIITPFDNTTYNTAGLLVRAAGPGGAPYNGDEDWINWTRFNEFSIPNYFRQVVNGSLTQINAGDYPNSNYWLRIDRVNDTQFNFYQKANESDPWELMTLGGLIDGTVLTRSDLAGVPMQVGICHATFSDLALQVQFEKFSLTGTNIGTGEVFFVNEPTNVTIPLGQPATFRADARGLPPIGVQWLRNGQPLTNQTNFTYTFTTTEADNNATFALVASNTVSGINYTILSTNALLSVSAPLVVYGTAQLNGTGTNGGGQLALNWQSLAGGHYQVVYKTNLTDSAWLPLGSVIMGTGSEMSVTNAIGATGNRFYRLQLLP